MESATPLVRALVLAVLGAIAAACTAVPQKSHRAPDGDAGTDSETATESESDLPEVFIQEDSLPGWRLSWAQQFGSGGDDVAGSMALCGSDTFAVTGWFCGEVSFGDTVMNGGGGHMFLVKMNIDGKPEWATWAGDAYTVGSRVAAAESGRLAVAGHFGTQALFGSGEPNETWLYEDANGDAGYLAVYEENGEFAWAREQAAVGEVLSGSHSYGLAFLPDGSLLVTGWFVGEMALGQDAVLSSADEKAAFVARYHPDGGLAWARRVGGPGRTHGRDLAALPDGSFVLYGTYYDTVVIGEGDEAETVLEAQGANSGFLARFDGNGELCWAMDLGVDGSTGAMIDVASSLTILSNGDLALTGQFNEGSMLAGDGADLSPVHAPGQGLFVARYTTEGTHVWTRVVPVGEPWSALCESAVLSDGTLVVAGRFSGAALFDSGQPGGFALEASHEGIFDGLLAAWSAEGELLWALRQGGGELAYDQLNGVEAFTSASDGHDILVSSGHFQQEALYGTGGGDTVMLSAAGDWDLALDIVLLRFDREAE